MIKTHDDETQLPESFKSGIVAIAGRPNVGKSTLMNSMLGQKLSIVSAKAQTTRQRINGILTGEDFQIVFTDTPGIINPGNLLQESMIECSYRAMSGADAVMLVIDADQQDHPEDKVLIDWLKDLRLPSILVINKIDLVKKADLLPKIEEYSDFNIFQSVNPVCALTGDGNAGLLKELKNILPCGSPYYDKDQIAVAPMRFFAAELIRETIFETLYDEIPYTTTVQVEEYKEHRRKKTFIRAVIYTERDSQKAIIIGKNGQQLKKIGAASRLKIEEMSGEAVFLDLWVKVREKWRKNAAFLKEAGYIGE